MFCGWVFGGALPGQGGVTGTEVDVAVAPLVYHHSHLLHPPHYYHLPPYLHQPPLLQSCYYYYYLLPLHLSE